jgi:MoaA/NifB/PqqE/SkfB family radical SAM enzyme
MFNLDHITEYQIEITTHCNASCPQCPRNVNGGEVNPHMPLVSLDKDVISQRFTKELVQGLKQIFFCGSYGDPIAHPDFLDILRDFRSKSPSIWLYLHTNGGIRSPEWWAELASYMNTDDKVYFSVCGSTQELHEIYRTNTKLVNILANARAFRSVTPVDYAQCIRFDYNDADFDSEEFKEMVSEFTNVYWTETFLLKDKTNYVDTSRLSKLNPNPKKVDDYLFMDRFAKTKFASPVRGKPWCMSWEKKSQQVDIDGKIYPCYLFLEASGGEPWDGDYEKILSMQYDVCKYCDRAVIELCDKKDLRYII